MARDPKSIKPKPKLPLAVFTVKPLNWSPPLHELDTFDVERRFEAFRQHANRVINTMDDRPTGWLFAHLHGAYDPATQSFPLHLHGFATGGMIDVIDGLRKLSMYAPARPHDGRDAANTPIVINRDPHSMPYGIHYFLLQRWWPLRETYLGKDGLRHAFRVPRQRIPEPAHSEYLQFLDSYALDKLMLRIGITVSANGLVAR